MSVSSIENKEEFQKFLESSHSKTKSKDAISSIISRVQYVANEYGGIDSSLTKEKVETIFSKLHITKYSRKSHIGDKSISSLKSALNKYLEYLKLNNDILSDITSIETDLTIKKTEKETLIQARLGQGRFREQLIELWEGMCSVSGYKETSFLIASHVKPWSKSSNEERLDKFNGLLLTPNLDKAFDKGFITFNSIGKIIISKELHNPEVLGISTSLEIKKLSKKIEKYMDFHRKNVFNDA